MSADLTPGGLFIELDPDDEWPKIAANTPDALEFDACRCHACAEIVAGWLYESDDGFGSGGRWNTTFMDAGWRLYCESCAYDLENLSLPEYVATFVNEPDFGPAAETWHAVREYPTAAGAPLTFATAPGVGDEIACCDLCGRSDSHDHDQDEYGTYYPDPDYPRGAL